MSLVNKKCKSNRIMIDFFGMYLLINCINSFVKINFEFNAIIWTLISRLILGLFLINVIIQINKNGKIRNFLIIELLTFLIFLISFFMGYSVKSELIITFINVESAFIPLAFSIYYIDAYKFCLKRLYKWSLFCVIIGILFSIIVVTSFKNQYFMSFGYTLLIPICVIFHSFFDNKKWWDLIIGIIGIFLIILYGSRGPLLCIAIYFILTMLRKINFNKINFKFIILLIAISCGLIFYKQFIILFVKLVNYLGFSSRTLTKLLNSTISSDSGRSLVYKFYINKILEKPIFGYGIMGQWNFKDRATYPHNIFIELFLSFGLPIGTILSFFIIILLFNTIIKKNNENLKSLSLIFVSTFTCLLVSFSFVQYFNFYITIAICIKNIKVITSN